MVLRRGDALPDFPFDASLFTAGYLALNRVPRHKALPEPVGRVTAGAAADTDTLASVIRVGGSPSGHKVFWMRIMAHEDELRRAQATGSPGQEEFESSSARYLAERLVEIGLLICWLFIAAKYLLGVI